MAEPEKTDLMSFEATQTETSLIEAFQEQHKRLLQESAAENEFDISSVNDFLKSLANAGAQIKYPEYRAQLRTLILYWSNVVNKETGAFPFLQLQPFDESQLIAEDKNLATATKQSIRTDSSHQIPIYDAEPADIELAEIAQKKNDTNIKIKKLKRDKAQYTRIFIGLTIVDAAIVISRVVFLYSQALFVAGLITISILTLLMGIAILGVQGNIARMESEIEALDARRRIVSILAGNRDQARPSYFDNLVQINLENLASYYSQVKQQADKSFLVSTITSVIGLTLITLGLVFGFTTSVGFTSYIASASGLLIEVIAGLFFYLYSRTASQMKEYHASLLSLQNVLLSLKIVEDTEDEKEKNKLVSQVISYLVRNPSIRDFAHEH